MELYEFGLGQVRIAPEAFADMRGLEVSAELAESLGQPGRARRLRKALKDLMNALETVNAALEAGTLGSLLDLYAGSDEVDELYLHSLPFYGEGRLLAFAVEWDGKVGRFSPVRAVGVLQEGGFFVLKAFSLNHDEAYASARART